MKLVLGPDFPGSPPKGMELSSLVTQVVTSLCRILLNEDIPSECLGEWGYMRKRAEKRLDPLSGRQTCAYGDTVSPY